jgi:Ala-tRNA(Pro) deacylase
MAIAPSLEKYLSAEKITYDVIEHQPAMSATRVAEICKISGDRLAKAVLLRSADGYLLAILPGSHHIRFSDGTLQRLLGCDVDLASEFELGQVFQDCVSGAVPPVGACYGLDAIVDDSIEEQPEVYMVAGDHETLVHMNHMQFARLTQNAWRGRFSAHD